MSCLRHDVLRIRWSTVQLSVSIQKAMYTGKSMYLVLWNAQCNFCYSNMVELFVLERERAGESEEESDRVRARTARFTYMLPYTHSIRLASSGSRMLSGICTSTRSKPTYGTIIARMNPVCIARRRRVHTNVEFLQYLADWVTHRPS